MKHLHFDIISGIAGDMAVGALLHLGAPLSPLEKALQAMGLGGLKVSSSMVHPEGVEAVRFSVSAAESEHGHRSWREVRKLLDRAGLSDGAHARSQTIFQRLAQAEANVHGTSVEDVAFHEVGAVDSIADVVGCALALDYLCPDVVTSSPALLGRGVVASRHGTLPVPAPATLELLKGIPTRGLEVESELTTPTGAAILATQVDRFASWPELVVLAIGYGAGSRSLEGRPNVLRAIVGEGTGHTPSEEILVEANIDDMNPEHFEYLMELLLEAGAHDVWLQPVIMKKSRPAATLALLCDESRLDALERALFTETTTIGIRRHAVTRRKLARRQEVVETPYGPVGMKIAGEGSEVWTVSPEYQDCRTHARKLKVPLKAVYQAAMEAWRIKK